MPGLASTVRRASSYQSSDLSLNRGGNFLCAIKQIHILGTTSILRIINLFKHTTWRRDADLNFPLGEKERSLNKSVL